MPEFHASTVQSDAGSRRAPLRRAGLALLAVMILIYTALTVGLYAERVPAGLGFEQRAQDPYEGLELTRDPTLSDDWRQVASIEPGSPLGLAGLQAGDRLKRDRPLLYKMRSNPGDTLGFTISRAGKESHAEIVLQARDEPPNALDIFLYAIGLLATFLVLALSLLVLWRRWGDPAAMCLGIIMFNLGTFSAVVPRWSPSPQADTLLYALLDIPDLALGLVPALFYFLSGSVARRWQGWVCAIWFAIFTIVSIESSLVIALQSSLIDFLPLPAIQMITIIAISYLLACVILVANYRRIESRQRNRIKVVLAAFTLILLQGLLGVTAFLGRLPESWLVAATIVSTCLGVGAATLFAFAMLRQRLFDFGFAINRTLVYGAAAFTLLVVFGLVEYIAKSMIPHVWPAAGPFISAGIAVLLFLAFHRLHHWFEHHIERLFFGAWHRAEAALRRFVESAGHFESAPKLGTSLVEALRTYAHGAEAAFYAREADGSYRREAGELRGAPQSCADDDPAFALMRVEREPVDLAQATGTMPGALALPMLDHGVLTGFVLVGPKPGGLAYRPDEVENLGWAAQKVGLDLRALHARIMEEQNSRLSAEVASLAAERDTLRAILTGTSNARTA